MEGTLRGETFTGFAPWLPAEGAFGEAMLAGCDSVTVHPGKGLSNLLTVCLHHTIPGSDVKPPGRKDGQATSIGF